MSGSGHRSPFASSSLSRISSFTRLSDIAARLHSLSAMAALILAAIAFPYQLYPSSNAEVSVETARFALASAVQRTRGLLERLEGTDAIPSLEAAIQDFELAVFRDSPELAEPWMLLGDAHMQAGHIQAADNAYQQSIHINRVNHGLFTSRQLDTVFRQAGLLEAMGNLDAATGREEYALVLQRKRFGQDAKIIPGLYRMADWYLKVSKPANARQLYQEMIDMLSDSADAQTNTLVDAYIGLSQTYLMERFPPDGFYQQDDTDFMWQGGNPQAGRWDLSQGMFFGPAHRALMRAEELLQRSSGDSDDAKVKLSDVRISLGDLNMLFEKWGNAQDWYKSVFAMWGGFSAPENTDVSEKAQDKLNEWFGEPTPLHLPLPKEVGKVEDYPVERIGIGSITLAFSISSQGKVGRIETVAIQPDRFRDLRFRRIMRESRYRPQIVGGEAVRSDRLLYRHEFLYVIEEEDLETPPQPNKAGE